MKNLGITTILLLLAIFISSCSQKPSEMIIGEWKIVDLQTDEEIPAEMLEIHKQTIEDMKASSLLVFKPDSTFDYTISETTTSGKWTVGEDGKKLTMIYEEGNQEVSDINELTEKRLSVTIEINGSNRTNIFEKQVK